MSKITFNNSNNLFFQSLKQAVDEYFTEKGVNKTGNWKLYTKTIILIPAAVAIYGLLMFVSMPVVVSLLLCGLLGLTLASIGFNVMHDACHGSYSRKKWLNNVLGLSLNAMGGNAFFWKQKHNVIHHTYTNITGADDDIAQTKLLRQSPGQQWMPIHRYQHIYLTLAYAFTLFSWVLVNDFRKYFQKRIHNTVLQPMSRHEHFMFWISKVLYAGFYIVLPIILVGPIAWLIGYVTMGVVTGVALAYVFQLAHAVEGPEFEAAGEDDKTIESAWAVHQVRTTANFAPRNRIVSWLVGGLNYQVEHHLFPRISHIHYPAISRIVREHCEKFNLQYHCHPSVRVAVRSHIRTMKRLGEKA
ncbi:MAG TPA: acyl-CoA desaturase [Flavisolibacter sp.]